MKLLNKNVIITGAGKGLGEEIAKTFYSQGASIIVCDRSGSVKKIENLQTDNLQNQKIYSLHCDISDRRSVDDLYKFAMSKFDRIDVLINNAGIPGPLGNIEEVSWDEWVEAININLIGTVYMCRKVIEIFRQQDKGKIVNLSGSSPHSFLSFSCLRIEIFFWLK